MVNIMEAYINKLVLECPCPPRGLVKVMLEKYSSPGEFHELTQPPINELPYVNRSFFYTMIQNLSLDHIIQIFTNLLVEKPVIFNTFNALGNHSRQSTGANVADSLQFGDFNPPFRDPILSAAHHEGQRARL